jgi:integrase/recombinase XerD
LSADRTLAEKEIDAYIAQLAYEANLQANSQQSYRRDLRALLAWLRVRNRTLDSVDRQLLEQYLREAKEREPKHKRGEKMSLRSAARFVSSIRGFFRWRMTEGYANHNPAELLESPKLPRHLPDVLTVEEVDKLIDSVTGSDPLALRDRAMLESAYSCGLRVSELIGIRRPDLLLDEGIVRIRGKGGKQRIVPMGDRAVASLKEYLYHGRDWIAGRTKEGKPKPLPGRAENFIFLNHRGAPLTRFGFWTQLKKRLSNAGIETPVKPHTFRHTFATHLIEGGADLRVVQELLGHASITTTEIYTHLDRDYLRETVRSFHPRGKAK